MADVPPDVPLYMQVEPVAVPQPPWPPGLVPDRLRDVAYSDLSPGFQRRVDVWSSNQGQG
jgi:hypothetical protein